MKVKFMMTMAAAAMVLAACSNDDESDNWAGEIRLSSGLTVQQTDTRAATDIQGGTFDTEEKIDVFISEATTEGQATGTITNYTQPLICTTGANNAMNFSTNEQPYFPTSGNGVNIYAYYPSGKVSSIASTAQDIAFTVQTDQSGDNKNYKKSDLMYASANSVARQSDPVALTFRHLLSKVTITLVAGSGSPSLEGAIVKLKGVMPSTTLTPSTGEISAASGTPTDITVMTASNSARSGSAIVVPQNLETSFIEVKLANGGTLTSNGLKDANGAALEKVELTGGNDYQYTITVNLTSLGVKVDKIISWGIKEGSGSASM